MKILNIELAGFLSYSTPQFVDFTGANVFCISGPNGAGKSSILDGIVYALYGKIPRYAGRRVNTEDDIINHNSDRLSLSLKFKVGERVFLVRRELVKGKSQQANIFELIDEKAQPLGAKRNRDVNAFIENLLGMDYETFTRTVILPQNQIDRFLKPASSEALSERRQVLQRLLGLDIYKEIKKLANQKCRDISRELQMISDRLEGELKNYTREFVRDLEKKLKEKEIILKTSEEERQSLSSKIEELKSAIALFESHISTLEMYKDITARLNMLKGKKEEADRLEVLYQLQREAIPLSNLNREYNEKKNRLDSLKREELKQEDERERLYRELEKEKKSIEECQRYIDYSNKLLGFVPLGEEIKELEREKKELRDKEEELNLREKELASTEDEISRLSRYVESSESRLEELNDKMKSESEKWDRIKGILDDVRELKTRERDFNELLEKNKKLSNSKISLERELASIVKDIENLSYELSGMETELEKYHLERIKMSLSVGDICPVCGNVIESLPVEPVELQAVERLNSSYQEKKKVRENLSQRYAEINAKLERNNRDIEEIDISLKELEGDIKEIRAKVSEILEPYSVDILDEKLIESKIERERRELEVLINNLEKERDVSLAKINDRKEYYTKESSAIKNLRAQLDRDKEKIREKEKLLSERVSQTEISWEDFVKRDFLKESQEIKNRYQELLDSSNSNISKYRAYIEKINARLVEISDETSSLEKNLADLAGDIESMRRELEIKCQVASSSLEELSELKIDKILIDKIRRDFEELSVKSNLFEKDISLQRENLIRIGLDPDAPQGLRLLKEEYSAKMNYLRELEERITALSKEIGSLDTQLKNAKEQFEISESLLNKKKGLEKQFNYYKIIDDALSENKFPEFLIREVMENIINRASLELNFLTQGRYSFSLASDDSADIMVKDNWYPERSRKTYSLSGGESFLASIALAIAIAEEIRGKRSLDCLFIDEGFGSLDDTGLDSIVSALAELENSGIMIGVITHNRELASRFPYRIEVEKDERGSRIKEGGW
ncbi:MAG: AAA family ATPase [Dictyoglomi bacterium]|nr:AAA family ATPase [Dictyoglomota bacterium]